MITEKTVLTWLGQTSTQAALLTIAGVGTGLATHLMTKDAALLLAVPALIGLVVHDKKEAATLAADALPIAEDLASGNVAAAVTVAEGEAPAVLAVVTATPLGGAAITRDIPAVAAVLPGVVKRL